MNEVSNINLDVMILSDRMGRLYGTFFLNGRNIRICDGTF